MNNKNKIGPNTLPYGTPSDIWSQEDKTPFTSVCCDRLNR